MTWADDLFLIARNSVEAQTTTSEAVDALHKNELVVSVAKAKVWSASGRVARSRARTMFGSLASRLGQGSGVEGPLKFARSVGCEVNGFARCAGFAGRRRCASAGVRTAWSWKWSRDMWKTSNSNVIRMLCIMAHISRVPAEPWLGWHVRSRPSGDGVRRPLHACKGDLYLHSRLYNDRSREVYRRAGLARSLGRGR